jgi:hypothetical protein
MSHYLSIYLVKPFFHQNGQGDQVEHFEKM